MDNTIVVDENVGFKVNNVAQGKGAKKSRKKADTKEYIETTADTLDQNEDVSSDENDYNTFKKDYAILVENYNEILHIKNEHNELITRYQELQSSINDMQQQHTSEIEIINNTHNEKTENYGVLEQKYNDLLSQHQELQDKCIMDDDIRQTEMSKLQEKLIDMEMNETAKRELEEFKDVFDKNVKELSQYKEQNNDLNDKLVKSNNEIQEIQCQYKKEIESRSNNMNAEIDNMRNQSSILTQTLNEKNNDNEKLRDQNTELLTKLNKIATLPNNQDKSCVIN